MGVGDRFLVTQGSVGVVEGVAAAIAIAVVGVGVIVVEME